MDMAWEEGLVEILLTIMRVQDLGVGMLCLLHAMLICCVDALSAILFRQVTIGDLVLADDCIIMLPCFSMLSFRAPQQPKLPLL